MSHTEFAAEPIENRIIEAAKQVFVRKGFEATKMSDIAAEVGLGRTAINYYYRTKELLFDAVFCQLMDSLLPNIKRIVEEDTNCLEKIPQLVNQYVNMVQDNPLMPVFVVNELNRDPHHLYQAVLRNSQRIEPLIKLRRLVEEEMSAGTLKRMPLVYVVSTLMSLIIFPMLIRNPLTTLFLNDDVSGFDAFIEARKPFISQLMIQLLTPDLNT